MQSPLELIEGFYKAFAARDGATMAACYHADARFSDPGFPNLRGAEVGAMWRMLTERAQQFSLTYSDVQLIGTAIGGKQRASANWVARYEFSATGRMVENRIHSEFVIENGLIVEQSDHFPFYRWVRQALGPVGWLLGWSGFLKRKVQTQADKNLRGYMAKSASNAKA